MKQSTRNGADDLKALGQELGVSLPPDAKIVGVDRQAGMDDMIRAKVELSPGSFASIADQLPVKGEQLTRGPGRLGADHEFWNPHATPGVRSGQVQLPGARVLHIGLAEYPDKVVLFVLNHGT
jgi:hypothetical protein